MLVLYYFQGELGESLEQPNAVMVNGNANKITFAEFLSAFPFKKFDRFRFRFRKEDSNYGYVWLDISKQNEILPIFNGVVTAKVLKLDSLAVKNRAIYLKQKLQVVNQTASLSFTAKKVPPPVPPRRTTSTSGVSPSNGSTATEAQREKMINRPSTESMSGKSSKSVKTGLNSGIDDRDMPSSPFHKSSKTQEPNLWEDSATTSTHQAPDILNFDGDDNTAHSPLASRSGAGDFMTFDSPHSASKKSNASVKSKGRNGESMSTSAMDIDESPVPSSSAAPLNRAALAAKREDEISEKVQNALDFKKEMDTKAQREAEEFDSAREKHDRNLTVWATGNNNKEKRNIRTLLSTMHTVLPGDSKWKAVGLGDVLEPRQVKLQYRKAMLVVHPDHTIGLDAEHKFICKRVFEALNEAWDDFNKKEGL